MTYKARIVPGFGERMPSFTDEIQLESCGVAFVRWFENLRRFQILNSCFPSVELEIRFF